jgi:hypothetical protein
MDKRPKIAANNAVAEPSKHSDLWFSDGSVSYEPSAIKLRLTTGRLF